MFGLREGRRLRVQVFHSPPPPPAYYYPRHRVNTFPREFRLTCCKGFWRILYVYVCVRAREGRDTAFYIWHISLLKGGGGDKSVRLLFCICLYVLAFEFLKQVIDFYETRYERHVVGRQPKTMLFLCAVSHYMAGMSNMEPLSLRCWNAVQ